MTRLLTRLGFFLLWLFHWLPLCMQAAIGIGLGRLIWPFARRRRRIALRNLESCFPEKSRTEIEQLAFRNILLSVRAALEHGLQFWASEKRLQKLVRIEGREHLDACLGRPLILLVPHFVGIDMGGIRLSTELQMTNIYRRSENPVAEHYMHRSRTRFMSGQPISNEAGIRPLLKLIKSGMPLHYSPDNDYGRDESIFVPFFGIPAATIPALSRLAKATGARVVPAITRMLPGGQGYVVKFYPAWENFPSDDVEADTRRMNAYLEERIRELPEQYLWTHRRFKTRPNRTDPRFYD